MRIKDKENKERKKKKSFSDNWKPENNKEPEILVSEIQPEDRPAKSNREEDEEEKIKAAAMLDLCGEIVESEFTIPAIVTGDPRWRNYAAQERMKSLALRWQVFFHAWGIEFAGKVSATIALALGHATAFGEVQRKIGAEDAQLPPEAGEDRTQKPN